MKRFLLAVLALTALAAPADAGRWVTTDLKWQNTSQGRPTLLSGLWPASLTSIYTRDSLWATLDSAVGTNIAGGSSANAADTTFWFSLADADPAIMPLSSGADSLIIGYLTLWSDSTGQAGPGTATSLNARLLVANPGKNFRQDTTGTGQILHITRGLVQTLTFASGSTNLVVPISIASRGGSGSNSGVMAAAGLAGQMAVEFSSVQVSAVGGGAEVLFNRLPRMRLTLTYYDNDE